MMSCDTHEDLDFVNLKGWRGFLVSEEEHSEAVELGMSPGAARMTLSRARAKLHDRFNAQQKISHLVQLAKMHFLHFRMLHYFTDHSAISTANAFMPPTD